MADDRLDESQRELVERLRTMKWPEPSAEARERGWRMLRHLALGNGAPLDGDGDGNGHVDEESEPDPPQVSPPRSV